MKAAPEHLPFRTNVPKRSRQSRKQNYRSYKKPLRADFQHKCGYCDDHDDAFGNERGSHIDHFAPKSKFPELQNEYENLVYSCPYCNGAKSDKWYGTDASIPNDGTKGFVDPCNTQLDQHLGRKASGEIFGLTPLGRFMVQILNLKLARHQFNWQHERIYRLRKDLSEIRQMLPVQSDRRLELLEMIADLCDMEQRYTSPSGKP